MAIWAAAMATHAFTVRSIALDLYPYHLIFCDGEPGKKTGFLLLTCLPKMKMRWKFSPWKNPYCPFPSYRPYPSGGWTVWPSWLASSWMTAMLSWPWNRPRTKTRPARPPSELLDPAIPGHHNHWMCLYLFPSHSLHHAEGTHFALAHFALAHIVPGEHDNLMADSRIVLNAEYSKTCHWHHECEVHPAWDMPTGRLNRCESHWLNFLGLLQ